MSHSNGRIYIDTSVTPNIGISISDIQIVLGYPRHPVTGEVINDIGGLITYGDINKWSRHKPVPYPSWVEPDSGWNGMWNQAVLVKGMIVPNASTIGTLESQSGILEPKSGFIYDIVNGNAVWNYLHPAGGSSEPFRFLDFDGYISTAPNPFPMSQTVAMPLSQNYQFNAILTLDTTLLDGAIYLNDLTSGSAALLSTYYAGAVLWRTRNGKVEAHFASAAQPLNNTSENRHLKIPFTLPGVTGDYTPVGAWNARSFLSNVALTADSLVQPLGLTDLVACDDLGSVITLSLYGGKVTATISARNHVASGRNKVKLTVTILNQTPNTATISGAAVTITEFGETAETVSMPALNTTVASAGEITEFAYTTGEYPAGNLITASFHAVVSGVQGQTEVTAETNVEN